MKGKGRPLRRRAKPTRAGAKVRPHAGRKAPGSEVSSRAELQQRLEEALEQRAATNEILRVISSSPTDVQPVFDAIVRSAVTLCGADNSVAARFDGELLHPLAYHGFSPEALEFAARSFPMRPTMENMLGRAALTRAVNNLPDMLADPEYSRDYAMTGGWRSGLAVPMLRDGQLIGAISVSRTAPGAFADQHVELLKTFADQALIAIENVRLFKGLEARNREVTEALDQKTATSEILRVIASSPTDLQPVFDTIAERAMQLCKRRILNLLSNALKFTPEGGQIDVGARRVDQVAEVSVADTGIGIAPEDQDAVFEEFRQVGTADKKAEGTGLGLALSRKFIELHGGKIWVKSQVGAGSTFTFTLPLSR